MLQYYLAIVLSAIAAMGALHAEEDQSGALAAGAVLSPDDYGLWTGQWLSPHSDLAENYYAIVTIHSVDANGLTYESECRDVPYGPNATLIGEKRALFLGPRVAQDAETGAQLTLRINPDDRHDRILEFPSAPCLLGEVAPRQFLYQRSVYKAGFDCDRAATPVEHAICGNELIARGDFEAGELYRELRASLPEDQALELRAGQRAWLRLRNDRCTSGKTADEACLAHLYGDRLAALARLANPHLGDGHGFDSTYALARIVGGVDLRLDTIARLAMYPLRMDSTGAVDWQANPDGLLFEQSHVKTRIVGPSDMDFRYSDMLYVDRDGTVWTVEHTETAEPLQPDSSIAPDRLWLEAGRDPLTVRTEAESTAPYPPPVARWLDERGVAATARLDLRSNALTALSEEDFDGLSSLQSLNAEDNTGAPFELSLRRKDSWCTVQQAAYINFQRNGETVSICEDEGVLTYFIGHPGAEPEFRYSGRILANLGGASVNAGEVPYRNLADLAAWTDDPEESQLLKERACSSNTNGFIAIHGLTGFFSSTVYVFRNGGWQYEVGGEWGRTMNVPEGTDEHEELANHEEYSMIARPPDEQDHCLN